jgi:uncharacterized repeat protein (TIGR03847 family)
MAKDDIVLDPIDRITVDALGKPGQRVFYIQAEDGKRNVTLIIEKIQLQSLLEGINEFLKQIMQRFPNLSEPEVSLTEENMHIKPPVDPLFRAGDMGLAYDEKRDFTCIFAREAISSTERGRTVRYWCSRTQLIALARWGKIVVQRGRPICPQCQQPIEPEGHFCPKKNGRKHGKI